MSHLDSHIRWLDELAEEFKRKTKELRKLNKESEKDSENNGGTR